MDPLSVEWRTKGRSLWRWLRKEGGRDGETEIEGSDLLMEEEEEEEGKIDRFSFLVSGGFVFEGRFWRPRQCSVIFLFGCLKAPGTPLFLAELGDETGKDGLACSVCVKEGHARLACCFSVMLMGSFCSRGELMLLAAFVLAGHALLFCCSLVVV